MATPLWNSFNQALPPYPYTGGPHTVHDVGSTAKKTYPPKFAIERSSTGSIPWSQIGRRYLQQINRTGRVYDMQTALVAARATLPQVAANMQPLFQAAINADDLFVTGVHSIPQTEENLRHTNEADVVRSANLYLIHPVIQALSSHPSYFQGLVSQSEDWKNKTQTDITFMKVGFPQPASAQVHRDFFIMELKRRGMIKASYFRHSIPLPRNGQFANQQAFNTHILMPVAPGRQPTQTQIAAVQSVQAPVIQGLIRRKPNPCLNQIRSSS